MDRVCLLLLSIALALDVYALLFCRWHVLVNSGFATVMLFFPVATFYIFW